VCKNVCGSTTWNMLVTLPAIILFLKCWVIFLLVTILKKKLVYGAGNILLSGLVFLQIKCGFRFIEKIKKLLKYGKMMLESRRKELFSWEMKITFGHRDQSDPVDIVLKSIMIEEFPRVVVNLPVLQDVTAIDISKYGIWFLWNLIGKQMELWRSFPKRISIPVWV